ncbi:MAG: hypothetical protein ABIT07_08380 [Ferruginibacter sp.]
MGILVEVFGWVGAVLIVGAYSLNIYGIWKTSSRLYILCNLAGGFFFILNTFVHKAYPSMIVNIIWVLIAVSALFKKERKIIK